MWASVCACVCVCVCVCVFNCWWLTALILYRLMLLILHIFQLWNIIVFIYCGRRMRSYKWIKASIKSLTSSEAFKTSLVSLRLSLGWRLSWTVQTHTLTHKVKILPPSHNDEKTLDHCKMSEIPLKLRHNKALWYYGLFDFLKTVSQVSCVYRCSILKGTGRKVLVWNLSSQRLHNTFTAILCLFSIQLLHYIKTSTTLTWIPFHPASNYNIIYIFGRGW